MNQFIDWNFQEFIKLVDEYQKYRSIQRDRVQEHYEIVFFLNDILNLSSLLQPFS
jgi:hypothetical protein